MEKKKKHAPLQEPVSIYRREIYIAMFLQIQSDVQSLFFLEAGGESKNRSWSHNNLPFGWIPRVKIPIQISHIQHFTWTSLFSFLEKRGRGGGGEA